MALESDEAVRVWLVEQTYSDDKQNFIILTYSSLDGSHYFRKERALTSFTGAARETTATRMVESDHLGSVDDPELEEQIAAEARRMAEIHEP